MVNYKPFDTQDILQHQHETDITFSRSYGLYRLDNESYEQFQQRMVGYHNAYSLVWGKIRPVVVWLLNLLGENVK